MKAKRVKNILKYGLGEKGRARKNADREANRRSKFFDSDMRWEKGEELAQRKYASYEDYVEHQASKLSKIEDRLHETEQSDYEEFVRRFETCAPLKEANSVLCLGARLGTEVRALLSLGYFAVGIDLNPGKDNSYVLPGDFHAIIFPDASVDAIYTNTLDHVFDLGKLVSEIERLLKPGGLFVTDMELGYEEGFVVGEYEASHWRTTQELLDKICALGDFELVEKRDLGKTRRDQWIQGVLRKRAA